VNLGPAVSVCLPAFNAVGRIERAIQSVLAQTYDRFELVIVDDASTDATVETIRRWSDPRIRLSVNPRNLGMARNWNETVRRARAPLVKFLHDDDALEPECLARLVSLFGRAEEIGFAFSRRRIELTDPKDPWARAWQHHGALLHTGFGELEEINSGLALFERWLKAGLSGNWVGEPSCVIVRKECLREVGGFSTRIRQTVDADLWVRLMTRYDVGFVDEELSVYRFGGGATERNVALGRDWLDRLWMLEGLIGLPELHTRYPALRRLHRTELKHRAREFIARARRARLRAEQLRDAGGYAAWRLRRVIGAPPHWETI
jgi:glycosyltransferase involved in cell wall biosynthesis